MIYLNFDAVWCGPCKWLKENVFTNDAVADFYNSNFICAEVDIEKGDGPELRLKYDLCGTPDNFFLSSNGDVLHRSCGARPAKEFIQLGKNALNPKTQLETLRKQYRADPSNGKSASEYFIVLAHAGTLADTIVENYFKLIPDAAMLLPENWKLLYVRAPYTSKQYKYFEANVGKFLELYGRDSIETLLDGAYERQLLNAHIKKNDKEFGLLTAKFRTFKTKKCEKIIAHCSVKLAVLPYADAKNAIEIEDSIVGPVNVSIGYGAKNEYQSGKLKNVGESNSIWFKFTIDHDTTLTFDLVPLDSMDDYDFTLFREYVRDTLKQQKGLIPIKVCFSYCTSKSGMTGLSDYSQLTEVGAGFGPAYVGAVPVKAGETFYIMVDYADTYLIQHRSPLGFKLYFYDYYPKKRPILFDNLLFETNDTILTKESLAALDKAVALMKKAPISIEIRGHTDNVGSEINNQKLSEDRARAAYNYLLTKGIKKNRLFYKGCGSTKPVALNETEEGRDRKSVV